MMLDIDTPIFLKTLWGKTKVLASNEKYLFKMLSFSQNTNNDLLFHLKTQKTWFVASGKFELRYIDTLTAVHSKIIISVGDVVHLKPGMPHQLTALEAGDIFEVSTPHEDSDSYRILAGDSQKA